MKKINNKGFTIIELSVVFMALAFIVAGVLGARSMIKSSRVSNAQNLTSNSPVTNIDGLAFWVETSMINANIVIGAIDDNLEDIGPSGFALSIEAGSTSYAESSILKGLKTLYFDGNDCLQTSSPINAVKYTAFTVIAPSSGTGGSNIIFRNGNSATDATGWEINGGEIGTVASSRIITVTNDGTATNNQTIFVNNSASGTTSTVTNPTSLAEAFYIGCRNGGLNFFTGELAEIIVFNRVLFTDEIAEVQNYLEKKYMLNF